MRELAIDVAVSVAAGALMTLVKAFGTGALPVGTRLLYWLILAVTCGVVGGLVFRAVERRLGARPWLTVVLATLTMSVLFTPLVWGLTAAMIEGPLPLGALPLFLAWIAPIAAATTAVRLLVRGRSGEAAPTSVRDDPAPPATARLFDSLPSACRGAKILALEAEGHCLRVHTTAGRPLIWKSLAQAIEEMDGLDGRRVHRSWWVAREAVAKADRAGRRAVLTLVDGVEAPVSRPRLARLRAEGWLPA